MQPHEFWQNFAPRSEPPPWRHRYPAILPDGRVLQLPIRPLGETGTGIASLILNQASFTVESALSDALAERVSEAGPEVVVGLPTLGLSLARAVAVRLGHRRYVPCGNSRKFWYEERLSVPLRSVTSPGPDKRLYLDPRLLPLLDGRRVVLIDDVISTGSSISAGLDLLQSIGVRPVLVAAAMLQSDRWRIPLAVRGMKDGVRGVISTPLLRQIGDGWEEC